MSEPVALAEWIAAIRAELTHAVTWQSERLREASRAGRSLLVPPLRLEELKLEVEVETSAHVEASGGLKFWVVTSDVSARRERGTTQRITLHLRPTNEMHLGDDPGFLDTSR
jgi:Trypsin-co-occurring domain 2